MRDGETQIFGVRDRTRVTTAVVHRERRKGANRMMHRTKYSCIYSTAVVDVYNRTPYDMYSARFGHCYTTAVVISTKISAAVYP